MIVCAKRTIKQLSNTFLKEWMQASKVVKIEKSVLDGCKLHII